MEVMLANQAIYLEDKIFTLVVSFGLRFGVLGGFASIILNGGVLLRNILYEVFLVYIFYCFEKRERNLFENLHNTQEELSQLKNVLQQFTSPYISVYDCQNQKSLFTNQALVKSLENKDQTDFNQTITKFQSSIRINKNSIKCCGNPQTMSEFEFDNTVTLTDFIQELYKFKNSSSQTWLLSGSCEIKGELFLFDITVTSIIWEKTPSVLLTLDNVSFQKEISDLKIALENKDLLIATVSHELRTPLHGVLGLIQIVEPKIKEKEALDYLSLCKDNANLLLNLVNSLLDNQQIQHGEIKLNPSKVQIETLIKSVLSLFSFPANQKNTKLSAFIEEGVPSCIMTDENRLKQVLINLVSNALKFTFSGSITINLSQQSQGHLKFSVSDTGRGIKKDDLCKIFKMYTKLEDKEGFNKHGVGLGLAISNNIAKLLANHQNGINVESQYGSGSTFSFLVHQDLHQILLSQRTPIKPLPKKVFLTTQYTTHDIKDFEEFSTPVNLKSKLSLYINPLNPSTSKDPSNLLKISSKTRGRKEFLTEEISRELVGFSPLSRFHNSSSKGLVLVVDDVYMNILIAKNLLENSGYQVQTASSGQEAIDKLREFHKIGLNFACIFMDCQMPTMDGFEATAVLKRMMVTEKIKSVPIVALTASQDKNTVQKCYESGMVEHLSKPLVKEDILRVLSQFESSKSNV